MILAVTQRMTTSDKTDCIAWESAEDKESWVCICGNTLSDSGGFTCDKKGRPVHLPLEMRTTRYYLCVCCGRIFQADDLQIVGSWSPEIRDRWWK